MPVHHDSGNLYPVRTGWRRLEINGRTLRSLPGSADQSPAEVEFDHVIEGGREKFG